MRVYRFNRFKLKVEITEAFANMNKKCIIIAQHSQNGKLIETCKLKFCLAYASIQQVISLWCFKIVGEDL